MTAASASAAPRHVGVSSAAEDPTSIARLLAVDAVTATDAWAVGEIQTDGVSSGLIEHFDGATWQLVSSPDPGGALGFTLTGVSAVSAGDVWAVGSYDVARKGPRALALHWDGATWTQVAMPNPSPSGENTLLSVTAIATDDVWAVGRHTSSDIPSVTFVEHWDGASWTVMLSPNPSHRFGNTLTAISAVSDEDIWAVGSFSTSPVNSSTLVARWNGRRWTRPISPNPGTLTNELLGVSAQATKDVWAVGDASSADGQTAGIIEHWNDKRWKTVPGPDLGVGNSSLLAVSAAGKKDAWAVGYVDEGGVRRTLTVYWDGHTWSRVPSPSPGAFGNTLNGVLAGSSTSAWAVGSAFSNSLQADQLITSWDGQAWNLW